MSKVRSLLVGPVAKRYAADRWPNLKWDDLNKWAQGVALRSAEVAVAAVLDAMSEGPLHEQMVEAGGWALASQYRVSDLPDHEEAIARVVLSAALGAARRGGTP